jgi:glutathione synthase/RimK-type ligase-like ATP-grasp enzyme
MNVDVLVISSLYDFSTDLVIQELEKNGVSYLRLNKEHFSEYRLTINPNTQSLDADVFGELYCVTSDVRSIFYRQPVFLRNAPAEPLSLQEQLDRSQWMGFLRSLTIFKNARWMNNLASTYLAETKAYQLAIASEIGFTVPDTIIGNDVRKFSEFDGTAIIKSLDTVLLREGSDCLFTYSTISNVSKLDDDEVSSAPLTVQEYIYPKIDIRVTVIGEKLYATKITSEGKGIDDDWRISSREELEYTDVDLPRAVKENCFELLDKLNLNFGAIDLIQRNEEFVFIEINPTGEWGWLTNDCRRIDVDISNWLMER